MTMKMYSITEVSEMLTISSQVIRREISKNKLVGHRFGGRVYVLEEDLEAYIKQASTNRIGSQSLQKRG